MILAVLFLLAAAAAPPQEEALAGFQRGLPEGGSATLYVRDEGDRLRLRVDLVVGAERCVLPPDGAIAVLHSFTARAGNRHLSVHGPPGSPPERGKPAGHAARRQVLAAGSGHRVEVGSLDLHGLDPHFFEAEWSCLGMRFSERGCRRPLTEKAVYLGPVGLEVEGICLSGSLWLQGQRPLVLLRFQNLSGQDPRWWGPDLSRWEVTVVRANGEGRPIHNFMGGRRCGTRRPDHGFPPGAVRRAVVLAGELPGAGLPLRFEIRLSLGWPEAAPLEDGADPIFLPETRIAVWWEWGGGTGTRVLPPPRPCG